MEIAIPIVATKLQPPTVRDDILPRPRLLDALAAVRRRRLTLVCAGAGYGKTTLISAIAASNSPVAWYSLSPSDKDLAVFSYYLVQSLRLHRSDFGDRVLQLLSMKERSSTDPEVIAGELVNALSRIVDAEPVVVLDDFHFVDRNREILKTIDYLLTHLPANSHLVIATRRPPRLSSLPRLRMIGQVRDISEADLRFRDDEVQMLFNQIYDLCLSNEAASRLAAEAEGWIIGLQLAAQSLKDRRIESANDLLASLGANKKRLFEYLAEEVFKRQPPHVQRFLCDSSVLSTFSADVCDAVFERTDSLAMLDHIERNNLFAVEVADGCFRYHHLFRDFLRQQIKRQQGRLLDLHRRAGAYYESRGDHIQATQHYLAGADYPNAGRLIAAIGPALLRVSRFDTLAYWISQIPDSFLRDEPDLLFLQAQVFELRGLYRASLEWLERAAAAYASKKNSVGLCRVLRSEAYIFAWRLDRQAEINALYSEALNHLGPENRQERADLLRCIAWSDLAEGNPSLAFEHYREALNLYEELGDKEGILAALITPGMYIYHFWGDFSEALVSLNRAHTLALELGSQHRLAECLGCMAVTFRQLNRPDEAKESAERAVALSREIGAVQLEAHNLNYLGLANLCGRNPDLNFAKYCFEESARLAESEGNGLVRISALMWRVVALRRLGQYAEAAAVGDRLLDIAWKSPHRWLLPTVQVNVGSALINQDYERAESLLLSAMKGFTRFQDKWSLTIVNFWMAVLHNRSKPHQALSHLRASIELAKANGYGFWFVEEASVAAPLLAQAADLGIETEYCSMLLSEMRPESPLASSSQNGANNGSAQKSPGAPTRAKDGDSAAYAQLAVLAGGNVLTLYGELAVDKSTPLERPLLRIHCFGNFRVYVGDRLVKETEWQRRKVKSLLKYLATVPDHSATRDDIMELLWGDLNAETARTNLNRTLHVLRRVLEPQSKRFSSGYIATEYNVVRLIPEGIEMVDVDEFRRHLQDAESAERLGDFARAERAYGEAATLYVGDFLSDDPYEDWTIAERERFRSLYLSALEKVARWRLDARDYNSAIGLLRRALDKDLAREDIHALLIQCLARVGKRQEALRQYAICCKAIRDELDLEPSHEIQALYSRLLAGETI